jgi:PAS domain-containing protein
MSKDILELQKQLHDAQESLDRIRKESVDLKKAIWDILNYSNMYVLLLDSELCVRLINWNLATTLGYKGEKEVLGKCWLDFIPPTDRNLFKISHHYLVYGEKDTANNCREVINDVKKLDGELITIKWFNIPINSIYHMIFSMGIPVTINKDDISEDSIRTYYNDIIRQDRTMIESLRDVAIDGNNVYKLGG